MAEITAAPLPLKLSPAKGYRAWSVYVRANGETVKATDIEAALAARVQVIPRGMALELIARQNAERWQSRLIRLGGLALAGATAFTGGGLIKATPRVISALAIGATTAPEVARSVRATLPAFDTALLQPAGDVGGTFHFVVLAGRAREEKPLVFDVRPPAPASPRVAVWQIVDAPKVRAVGDLMGPIEEFPSVLQVRLMKLRLQRSDEISAVRAY